MPARSSRRRATIALGAAGVLFAPPVLYDLGASIALAGLDPVVLLGSLVFLVLLSGPFLTLAVAGEMLTPRAWWTVLGLLVGSSVAATLLWVVAADADPFVALGVIFLIPTQCLVVGTAVAWHHLRGPQDDHGVFTER